MPSFSFRAPVLAACLLAALGPVSLRAASTDAIPVEVENRSEPVLCAEKDNVTIQVSSRVPRACALRRRIRSM